MFRQDDPRYSNTAFPRGGCFVQVAYWYVNKIGNIPFTPQSILSDLARNPTFPIHGGRQRIVSDDLYVHSHDAIARLYGLKVKRDAFISDQDYEPKDDEQEILIWETVRHIHATGGDGHSHVTYDPLGYSETVRNGVITGKVILCWSRW